MHTASTWAVALGLFALGCSSDPQVAADGGAAAVAVRACESTDVTTCPDCPAGLVDDDVCSEPSTTCWTQCSRGYRSRFACTNGAWLEGRGEYSCADAGH